MMGGGVNSRGWQTASCRRWNRLNIEGSGRTATGHLLPRVTWRRHDYGVFGFKYNVIMYFCNIILYVSFIPITTSLSNVWVGFKFVFICEDGKQLWKNSKADGREERGWLWWIFVRRWWMRKTLDSTMNKIVLVKIRFGWGAEMVVPGLEIVWTRIMN